MSATESLDAPFVVSGSPQQTPRTPTTPFTPYTTSPRAALSATAALPLLNDNVLHLTSLVHISSAPTGSSSSSSNRRSSASGTSAESANLSKDGGSGNYGAGTSSSTSGGGGGSGGGSGDSGSFKGHSSPSTPMLPHHAAAAARGGRGEQPPLLRPHKVETYFKEIAAHKQEHRQSAFAAAMAKGSSEDHVHKLSSDSQADQSYRSDLSGKQGSVLNELSASTTQTTPLSPASSLPAAPVPSFQIRNTAPLHVRLQPSRTTRVQQQEQQQKYDVQGSRRSSIPLTAAKRDAHQAGAVAVKIDQGHSDGSRSSSSVVTMPSNNSADTSSLVAFSKAEPPKLLEQTLLPGQLQDVADDGGRSFNSDSTGGGAGASSSRDEMGIPQVYPQLQQQQLSGGRPADVFTRLHNDIEHSKMLLGPLRRPTTFTPREERFDSNGSRSMSDISGLMDSPRGREYETESIFSPLLSDSDTFSRNFEDDDENTNIDVHGVLSSSSGSGDGVPSAKIYESIDPDHAQPPGGGRAVIYESVDGNEQPDDTAAAVAATNTMPNSGGGAVEIISAATTNTTHPLVRAQEEHHQRLTAALKDLNNQKQPHQPAAPLYEMLLGVDEVTNQLYSVLYITGLDPAQRQGTIRKIAVDFSRMMGTRHAVLPRCYGLAYSAPAAEMHLVMEHLPFTPLLTVVRRIPHEQSQLLQYARQINSGLQALHTLGVAHHNVKGSTVLVDQRGQIKLSGFFYGDVVAASSSSSTPYDCYKCSASSLSSSSSPKDNAKRLSSSSSDAIADDFGKSNSHQTSSSSVVTINEPALLERWGPSADVLCLGMLVVELLRCGSQFSRAVLPVFCNSPTFSVPALLGSVSPEALGLYFETLALDPAVGGSLFADMLVTVLRWDPDVMMAKNCAQLCEKFDFLHARHLPQQHSHHRHAPSASASHLSSLQPSVSEIPISPLLDHRTETQVFSTASGRRGSGGDQDGRRGSTQGGQSGARITTSLSSSSAGSSTSQGGSPTSPAFSETSTPTAPAAVHPPLPPAAPLLLTDAPTSISIIGLEDIDGELFFESNFSGQVPNVVAPPLHEPFSHDGLAPAANSNQASKSTVSASSLPPVLPPPRSGKSVVEEQQQQQQQQQYSVQLMHIGQSMDGESALHQRRLPRRSSSTVSSRDDDDDSEEERSSGRGSESSDGSVSGRGNGSVGAGVASFQPAPTEDGEYVLPRQFNYVESNRGSMNLDDPERGQQQQQQQQQQQPKRDVTWHSKNGADDTTESVRSVRGGGGGGLGGTFAAQHGIGQRRQSYVFFDTRNVNRHESCSSFSSRRLITSGKFRVGNLSLFPPTGRVTILNAVDTVTNRQFVAKRVEVPKRQAAETVERLALEMHLARAAHNSSDIVKCYGSFFKASSMMFVMLLEYVPGMNLQQLRAITVLSEEQIRQIVKRVLRGLVYLHYECMPEETTGSSRSRSSSGGGGASKDGGGPTPEPSTPLALSRAGETTTAPPSEANDSGDDRDRDALESSIRSTFFPSVPSSSDSDDGEAAAAGMREGAIFIRDRSNNKKRSSCSSSSSSGESSAPPEEQKKKKNRRPGIAHIDIKPTNIMALPDGRIKIIDFGESRSFIDGDRCRRLKHLLPGTTTHFAAPETFDNIFGFKCDVWSVGCLVLYLLTGKLPFSEVGQNIYAVGNFLSGLRKKDARFAPPIPPGVSPACASFIEACLTPSPSRRPTSRQLLEEHEWMKPPLRRSVWTGALVTAKSKQDVAFNLRRGSEAAVNVSVGDADRSGDLNLDAGGGVAAEISRLILANEEPDEDIGYFIGGGGGGGSATGGGGGGGGRRGSESSFMLGRSPLSRPNIPLAVSSLPPPPHHHQLQGGLGGSRSGSGGGPPPAFSGLHSTEVSHDAGTLPLSPTGRRGSSDASLASVQSTTTNDVGRGGSSGGAAATSDSPSAVAAAAPTDAGETPSSAPDLPTVRGEGSSVETIAGRPASPSEMGAAAAAENRSLSAPASDKKKEVDTNGWCSCFRWC